MAMATVIVWHLAVEVVLLSRSCLVGAPEGAWRLAAWDAHQAVTSTKLDCEEVSTQLWMEVLMQCFVGLSYECSLYWGNTWPLEVVA